MDALFRQVQEVDALRSVYPDDESIVFSHEELSRYRDAERLACTSPTPLDAATSSPVCLSGCINIPDVRIHDAAVTIRFTLPAAYPYVSPSLQLISNAPREQLDDLAGELASFAAQHVGEEVLLLCVGHVATLLRERLDRGALLATAPRAAAPPAEPATTSHTLMHAVVWFHHIKSQKKRRSMAAWSAELAVGGMYKIGYPGVLLLEGAAADVTDFVARLRAQRWKAMAVRGEQRRECGSAEELRTLRRLPPRLAELQEEELGAMGDACRAAGLHDLFLCALKLERA